MWQSTIGGDGDIMIEPLTADQFRHDYARAFASFAPTVPLLAHLFARSRSRSVDDIYNRSHHKRYSHLRQDFWAYLNVILGYDLAEIGRQFGMHHTTVLHGVRQAKKRARTR